MGEFTSAEDAIAELYDATASDPYDDTQDALRDHLQDARVCILSELTALRAENARLRAALETIQRATESRIDSVASVAQAAINGNDNVLCRQCEGDPVGSGFIECSLCHETAFVPFDVALDSIDYEISRAYRARAALAGEEVGT